PVIMKSHVIELMEIGPWTRSDHQGRRRNQVLMYPVTGDSRNPQPMTVATGGRMIGKTGTTCKNRRRRGRRVAAIANAVPMTIASATDASASVIVVASTLGKLGEPNAVRYPRAPSARASFCRW